jgi:hypothetical protein
MPPTSDSGDLAQHRNFYNPEFDANLTDFMQWAGASEFKFRFAWWGVYDGLYDYLNDEWADHARGSGRFAPMTWCSCALGAVQLNPFSPERGMDIPNVELLFQRQCCRIRPSRKIGCDQVALGVHLSQAGSLGSDPCGHPRGRGAARGAMSDRN